jgi:hypothetical protein
VDKPSKSSMDACTIGTTVAIEAQSVPSKAADAAKTTVAIEPVETIKLNASTLSGKCCTVDVGLDQNVADLKRILQDYLDVPRCAQQLVCGLTVLGLDRALIRDIYELSKATFTPDIMVLKVHPWTRAERIVMEGGMCSEANGTYTRVNTNCYIKDGSHGSIRIFRYEADVSWPAAWYIERNRRHGIYYAVPDQSLTDRLDGDAEDQELGFPIPLGGWAPWTGVLSTPGELPAPEVSDVIA